MSLLITVRYGLPLGLFLLGLVFVAIEPNTTGIDGLCAATGAALALLLLNVLFRTGVAGDRDRDREEAARAYFDEHGRWPDEEASVRRGPSGAPVAGEATPDPEPEPPKVRDAPPLRSTLRTGAEPSSAQREPRREGARIKRQPPQRRPQ